ncbi:unnamed protein product [Rotaria magnacalcarata]
MFGFPINLFGIPNSTNHPMNSNSLIPHHQSLFGNSLMMPSPFGNMNGLMGSFGMNPSPFAMMDRLMQEAHQNPNRSLQSFSSTTVMSYNGTDGRPKVYQETKSCNRGPGGIEETRQAIRDTERGLNKVHIGRRIGDRKHVVEREMNTTTGQISENVELENLDEDEADNFKTEWRQRSAHGGVNYRHPHHPYYQQIGSNRSFNPSSRPQSAQLAIEHNSASGLSSRQHKKSSKNFNNSSHRPQHHYSNTIDLTGDTRIENDVEEIRHLPSPQSLSTKRKPSAAEGASNYINDQLLLFNLLNHTISVNMSRTGRFREFFSSKRNTSQQISQISTPLNVTKNIHVSYDPITKTFQGLPSEWEHEVKNLFVQSQPEHKAHVMTCALKVIQQTMRENNSQTKHLHIQDTSHSDGLSYESGDELSEIEYDIRSSQEKLNVNTSLSPFSSKKDEPVVCTSSKKYALGKLPTHLNSSSDFVEELKRATIIRQKGLNIHTGKLDDKDDDNDDGDDDDNNNSPKSTTPSNSRSHSPIHLQISQGTTTTPMYQIHHNRDTLINEDVKSSQSSFTPLSSNASKYSSTSNSPFIYSLPVRHHSNSDNLSANNTNGKDHQQKEQPPAVPPKTVRYNAATNKFSSSNVARKSPPVNKENTTDAMPSSQYLSSSKESQPLTSPTEPQPLILPKQSPPLILPKPSQPLILPKQSEPLILPKQSEPVSSSKELQPVQRHKSKSSKRKITEEEAIKELEPIAAKDDPISRFLIKKKIGSGAAGDVDLAIDTKTNTKIAIKRMLWSKQPRKELIVGEILVMKNCRFRSIVNFLDCYLRPNELWSKASF